MFMLLFGASVRGDISTHDTGRLQLICIERVHCALHFGRPSVTEGSVCEGDTFHSKKRVKYVHASD